MLTSLRAHGTEGWVWDRGRVMGPRAGYGTEGGVWDRGRDVVWGGRDDGQWHLEKGVEVKAAPLTSGARSQQAPGGGPGTESLGLGNQTVVTQATAVTQATPRLW